MEERFFLAKIIFKNCHEGHFSKKGEKTIVRACQKKIFQNKVSLGKANGRIMLLGGFSSPVSTYLR